MSANEVSLIECCVIFDGPDFFNSLSQERTLGALTGSSTQPVA